MWEEEAERFNMALRTNQICEEDEDVDWVGLSLITGKREF